MTSTHTYSNLINNTPVPVVHQGEHAPGASRTEPRWGMGQSPSTRAEQPVKLMGLAHVIILLLLILTLPLHNIRAATGIMAVTVQPSASLLFHPQHGAPATVLSLNDSQLSLEVTGTILDIPVQVGQQVQKGDLLIRLDPWVYKNQQQQAQSTLEETQIRLKLAQRQKDRTARLRKNGQASEAQFDQRQMTLNSLSAQIKKQQAAQQMAQDRLAKTVLKAPFSGVVAARTAQIGALAVPGTPLLRLVDHQQIELSAAIRPTQRGDFNQAWRGYFNLEGHAYPVRLRALVPVQDPQTRTQEARFLFLEETEATEKPPKNHLRPMPGAAGRLTWKDPRPHIPARLLVKRGGVLGVFLAREGKAYFHRLPHALEGQPAPLEKPLQEDIIFVGRESLTEGHAIAITQAPPVAVTR